MGKIDSMRKKAIRNLEQTKEDTRKRVDDELKQKIEDLKDEYAEKLEKELKLDEQDSEAATRDSETDLKAKKERKIKELRADLEKDPSYVEALDCLEECEKRLQDAEDKLASAKKFLF